MKSIFFNSFKGIEANYDLAVLVARKVIASYMYMEHIVHTGIDVYVKPTSSNQRAEI